ncbi:MULTISPECIES: methylated-DNA--[protein]-cysteine S-methyltransferase [Weissella]|uniref:methylated-DNA--[protein]-cysteine S-methyltransferase n=1 Tax=Weissella TaxID=46255 RepID=UPI0002191562|nr:MULTISPECIES: methylated-DNA--[protein]-cysteine S-methyltransferase [Weissella]APS26161.1 Bifunctional transcriptional activator/DNA repair enzyme Ada [Weissella cibaria]APU63664.1 Bifunctional transcriptional activator/DNA repair enzyme Ada [Weissella cibaria]APU65814.1 Bifunctional transcriptional activator/DNA repair enzyme Ada [Weissella cibaria]ASS52910.1 Bifunctional transcriptional activator/DNA repair enzyme Ada [Weissella cibaria]KXU07065.1 Methylated-DNA--protein-cysteine methylt
MINYESYPLLNGTITLFYSPMGVQFVSLADDPVAEYQSWYPTGQPTSATKQRYANLVAAYLAGRALPPYQVDWQSHGTDLQRQVWQYLQTIPTGTTMSYQALATAIGRPNAVRAIATAVAKNPLLILGACHRIVRQDGTLGNYRAGVTWKQNLLAFEHQLQNSMLD